MQPNIHKPFPTPLQTYPHPHKFNLNISHAHTRVHSHKCTNACTRTQTNPPYHPPTHHAHIPPPPPHPRQKHTPPVTRHTHARTHIHLTVTNLIIPNFRKMKLGHPRTTGKSHIKKLNTYLSTRDAPPPPQKVSKSVNSFFKPVKTSETPHLLLRRSYHKSPILSRGKRSPAHSESDSTDIDFTSQTSQPDPCLAPNLRISALEIPVQASPIDEESDSGSDTVITGLEIPDFVWTFRRRTDGKLDFVTKWERKYTWAYYSSSKGSWFCKTCEEYSDSGDEFWKSVTRKHDDHPGVFFQEHECSNKHVKAVKNKKEVKCILS